MAGEEQIPRWGVDLSKEVIEVAATMNAHLKEDEQKWKDNGRIHETLFRRVERPTWGVSITITGLFALVTALVMALLRK